MRGISFILSLISLLLILQFKIPKVLIFLISVFFLLSLISLLVSKNMFIFSQTIFYSIILLSLVLLLLEFAITPFILITIFVAFLGEIVAWTLQVDKPIVEKNRKITDFLEKSETLKKELPDDEIKEVIFIEKTGIFASKTGNKFHVPGCKIGDKIKDENRIYFTSESQARKKGFKKHKCKV